ncbi:MAG: hypothetical protein DWI13_04830 [Planctomycetota bacterium]|nr:MAG: hypothetical protein DWI13_04830 [Planctomycetota bacterium]
MVSTIIGVLVGCLPTTDHAASLAAKRLYRVKNIPPTSSCVVIISIKNGKVIESFALVVRGLSQECFLDSP